MNYDWQKIFKSKTNKELYDIHIGKVSLSKEEKAGKSANVFNDISMIKTRENDRIKMTYYLIFGIIFLSLLFIGINMLLV